MVPWPPVSRPIATLYVEKTMPTITLPDGSQRQFANPVTGAEVAAAIGPGLAKAALAVKLNGEVKDLSLPITTDAKLEIVTKTHKDALELIRHDAATCWPRRCRSCSPAPRSRSARRSRTASTTTSPRDEPFSLEDLRRSSSADARDRRPRRADHARGVDARRGDRATSRSIGETYKAEIIARHPDGRGDHASIARATGRTCAAARTCPRPASSARPSS